MTVAELQDLRGIAPPAESRRGAARLARRTAGHAVLLAFSLLAIYPFYYMVTTALKTPQQYLASPDGFPTHPSLASFTLAFQSGPLLRWLVNSAIVTFGATALVIAISVPAAFALGKMRFVGRAGVALVLGMLLGVPEVVILIPLFVLFAKLGLINSLAGIALAYAGLLTPFSIFLISSFVREVSQETLDAAVIDGASSLQILRYVLVPLIRPALVTAALIVGISIWNDLLFALVFLQSNGKLTIMAGLTLFESRVLTNQPLIMAGTLIATVPMVLVYIVGFRAFQRGITAGAFR